MTENLASNVTQLLLAWGKGDDGALNALMPQVRQELHRLAAGYMAGERPGHVLQATALVNEAYLRLVDWKNVQWADRAHFFAMAANVMRRVRSTTPGAAVERSEETMRYTCRLQKPSTRQLQRAPTSLQ